MQRTAITAKELDQIEIERTKLQEYARSIK